MSDLKEQHPEVPVIVIERDDEPVKATITPSAQRKWLRRLVFAVCGLLLLVLLFAGYKWYNYNYRIGIPVSTSHEQNIEKLKAPTKAETAEVILTSDSLLGVALDFYAIHGLRASIEFQEPDTADASVYLYCRSADHTAEGRYHGSLVADGRCLQNDRSRLGYMAMADGRTVIGISRSDKVKDYALTRSGSFFRQFVLVSDGTMPPAFSLHGKVERRAIGRMGNTLYYIATPHKETMWDFADAIREYGFTDAIYITGGKDYSFFRSRDGQRHDIGNVTDYPHKKWAGMIPWLVFRTN